MPFWKVPVKFSVTPVGVNIALLEVVCIYCASQVNITFLKLEKSPSYIVHNTLECMLHLVLCFSICLEALCTLHKLKEAFKCENIHKLHSLSTTRESILNKIFGTLLCLVAILHEMLTSYISVKVFSLTGFSPYSVCLSGRLNGPLI